MRDRQKAALGLRFCALLIKQIREEKESIRDARTINEENGKAAAEEEEALEEEESAAGEGKYFATAFPYKPHFQ